MSGWEIVEAWGVRIARSIALASVPGFRHAFSIRRDAGGRPFDLGGPGDDRPEVEERRRRLATAAGLDGRDVTVLRQVHGAGVVSAAAFRPGMEGDAVVWTPDCPPDVPAPAVRTADCVPVLLAIAGQGAAAVHAGWRGTVAGVVPAALGEIAGGGDASLVIAALGPAIGPCCYPVGPDVARAVSRAGGGDGRIVIGEGGAAPRVDLRAAIASQLRGAGVPAGSIHVAPWCTACREDLFWSYRRDGEGAGRSMALIGAESAPRA